MWQRLGTGRDYGLGDLLNLRLSAPNDDASGAGMICASAPSSTLRTRRKAPTSKADGLAPRARPRVKKTKRAGSTFGRCPQYPASGCWPSSKIVSFGMWLRSWRRSSCNGSSALCRWDKTPVGRAPRLRTRVHARHKSSKAAGGMRLSSTSSVSSWKGMFGPEVFKSLMPIYTYKTHASTPPPLP